MKKIFWFILSWRLGLFAIAAIVTKIVGFLFPYPNFQYLIELGYHIPWLWSWGGFDGIHYITIVENGYIADYTQAFFPVYPTLARWLYHATSINPLFSLLIVTHISVAIAAALFYRLLSLDQSKILAQQTIVTMFLFPTAFFLGAAYSEATFLALMFGTFLAARKKKWLAAGIIGGVASATRTIGIFLLPALIIEYWQQWKEEKPKSRNKRQFVIHSLPILIVPLGLLLYMNYLQIHFNDPLKFFHSQPAFGAERSNKIILLYQVAWRYIKMMVTVEPTSLLYFRIIQEFLWSITFLILGIISFKKTRHSYATFAILSFIVPTLTGTFSSMPRYILVMFPAFMVLAQWLSSRPELRKKWYLTSAGLLIINMGLFLTGRWVA